VKDLTYSFMGSEWSGGHYDSSCEWSGGTTTTLVKNPQISYQCMNNYLLAQV